MYIWQLVCSPSTSGHNQYLNYIWKRQGIIGFQSSVGGYAHWINAKNSICFFFLKKPIKLSCCWLTQLMRTRNPLHKPFRSICLYFSLLLGSTWMNKVLLNRKKKWWVNRNTFSATQSQPNGRDSNDYQNEFKSMLEWILFLPWKLLFKNETAFEIRFSFLFFLSSVIIHNQCLCDIKSQFEWGTENCSRMNARIWMPFMN